MTYNKLVHYAIRLNGFLPPAVVSGEEPIYLSIYLPASTRTTTPSPTSSPSLFPLLIPPRHASPTDPLSEEGITAIDEWFYTPEGLPMPTEEAPPSPTVTTSEEALSEGSTEVEEEVPVMQNTIQLPEDLEIGGWVHLQCNLVNHIIRTRQPGLLPSPSPTV